MKKIIKRIKCEAYTLMYKIRFAWYKNVEIGGLINKKVHMQIDKSAFVSMKDGFICNENVFVRVRKKAKLVVGKRVAFGNNLILTCRNKINIGDDVMIGPNVLIFDHDHNYRAKDRRDSYVLGEIEIGNNAWIGGGCIILKGSKIGKNAVIAAGALVNCEVPENSIYYGRHKMKQIEERKSES